ncbi:MAG: hypothetical protein A2583_00575 [Bdellovibrionales bacterium RIFOXYD1_FULL_53_11]|nr:MAG: hypothetical protein A2583_00575 [Bdellovibrionales bacterium RIFOXYD1_FULL_53_11]
MKKRILVLAALIISFAPGALADEARKPGVQRLSQTPAGSFVCALQQARKDTASRSLVAPPSRPGTAASAR